MPDLIAFQFNGHEVPAIRDEQGEPWWKASDVCEHCEIKNVSKACDRLDADEKAVLTLSDSAGRPQDMLIVNEAGLYTLVLSSRKSAAKVFKRWVTHEVLPSIRKTGRFEEKTPQVKNPANQMLIDMVVRLDTVEQRAIAAETKADLAIHTQQFLTIAEYVFLHDLKPQMPDSFCKEYGLFLSDYCQRKGIPFRDQGVGGKRWNTEHAYHVGTMHDTLEGWLKRRYAQPPLQIVPRTPAPPSA